MRNNRDLRLIKGGKGDEPEELPQDEPDTCPNCARLLREREDVKRSLGRVFNIIGALLMSCFKEK